MLIDEKDIELLKRGEPPINSDILKLLPLVVNYGWIFLKNTISIILFTRVEAKSRLWLDQKERVKLTYCAA